MLLGSVRRSEGSLLVLLVDTEILQKLGAAVVGRLHAELSDSSSAGMHTRLCLAWNGEDSGVGKFAFGLRL